MKHYRTEIHCEPQDSGRIDDCRKCQFFHDCFPKTHAKWLKKLKEKYDEI